MEKKFFEVKKDDSGLRLDKYLSTKSKDLSRSFIQKLVEQKQIIVNNQNSKVSYRVKEGDKITLIIPEPSEPEIKPVELELDILYEDQDIIVVNKQAGLIVHPVPGNRERTLVNGLLAYTDELAGINGIKRPGIVHRLDKDTSGALVVAKNDKSHRELVKQFKKRKTRKIYRLIVKGILPHDSGKIDAPIGRNPKQRKKMAVVKENSKSAITHFWVLERFAKNTYVEVRLETGRTHQIRVHFSFMGFPILGDEKYGKKKNKTGVQRQLLHAYQLGFFHPLTEEWMEFTAPLPQDFRDTLNKLKGVYK